MTSQFASLCDVEMFHLCFTNTDSAFWHRECQPDYFIIFFRLLEAAKFWNKSFLFSQALNFQITNHFLHANKLR